MTNKKGKPLWEGHRKRLRQRMQWAGWESLRPHEMLELVLFRVVPRKDVSVVARLLVDRFGSVGGVFAATREQLMSVNGVTESMARWIELTNELIHAYYALNAKGNIRLSSYQEVLAFLRPRRSVGDGRPWVIYVSFNYNMIMWEPLKDSPDWWDGTNISYILKNAIATDARFLFLVLWGDNALPEMNQEDEDNLKALAVSLHAAEVNLLDCLLVGGGQVYSMNVHNRMPRMKDKDQRDSLRERYVKGEEYGAGS